MWIAKMDAAMGTCFFIQRTQLIQERIAHRIFFLIFGREIENEKKREDSKIAVTLYNII